MVTKNAVFVVGIFFLGALTAACGDTGTPLDNGGAPNDVGDAAGRGDSRASSGSTSGTPNGASSGSSGTASGSSGSTSGGLAVDAGDAGLVTPPADAGSVDASTDSGAGLDGGARTDGGPVRYATTVAPLLDGNCTNACHGGCGGLTISYASIVNVKSGQVPRLNYVTPKDAGHSYLWCKVSPTDVDCTRAGTTIINARMPLGGPYLSAADSTTIKTWILQGAPNN